MPRFREILLLALLVVGPCIPSSAFAQVSSWRINGFANGTVTATGPVSITVFGVPTPCTATFTLALTSGQLKVTGVSFSGSSVCNAITIVLPWPISAPTPVSGSTLVNFLIQSINIKVSGVTCTGSASGTVSNANPNNGGTNAITFVGSLGPCNFRSNPSLTSSGIGTQ